MLQGEAQKLSPHPQAVSPSSQPSHPEAPTLFIVSPPSPRAEEKSISVFADSASSEQMQS